ncbi:TetR family transcriptional regulator [Cryobacterium roopkundense]|uniref:AcrR family transcriptional regulator n=1 Tax=Cryobacterium roopkundense TaxID=1001240 RepID=A0A099JGH6_9MICO|nr:TetR family transcriptional regulator C-terminal domain-containing protein [Cryobacterium roopkundense]KGJ77115.1 TetR family transcriptional regulator [Cryobacterium roopkundense]MBB5641517.1 AcrR family transcriptional regulator [Cryobacterium roopkundense]
MSRETYRDARKVQLAQAVWQVILDRGISAVSVRAVANEAGVVVGSLRHVFPTRTELLQFSAELMVQRATDRVLTVREGSDPAKYALEVLKNFLPLTADSRAELEVNIALIAESPALPQLVAIRNRAYQELGNACLRLTEKLACRPSDPALVETARHLHAVLDGLAIHLLMEPPDNDSTWATEILKNELARISRNP